MIVTGVHIGVHDHHDNKASVLVHYIFSYLSTLHISYSLSCILWRHLQKLHPLLCFYRPNMKRASAGCLCILLNTVYYHVVFHEFLDYHDFGHELYITTVICTLFYTLSVFIYVSFCILFFFLHHRKHFHNIINTERALTFNGNLISCMEILNTLEHQSLLSFVNYWRGRTDDDILQSLPSKRKQIFDVLRENLDKDGNNEISYDEFQLYAHKNNIMDTQSLWDIFTYGQKVEKIDEDLIDYMLYHTLFEKKQFASAIDTDILLANWILTYLSMFSVPLLGIIISSVWGYKKSFEGSLSLFEVYTLIVTFVVNRLINNFRFTSFMASVRPFNLGELLYYENDVYKVTKFSPSYVVCVGRDTIILRNAQMLDTRICNYSRSCVSDSFTLELPLNTGNEMAECVLSTMKNYALQNWKEIDVASVRCGWQTMKNQSKVLHMAWKYNFLIYDRSRFNKTKMRFVNAVIKPTISEVTRSILLMNAIQCCTQISPEAEEHFKMA